ncbi:N amino acid transport system protein [Lachnellula subtilissima]|uniref:N amino acid transport system protein n=1 Tax=Lachnellula subtilissima TaxID=602034 RepID=A0A8H8UE89_9HELO|nr:N amino acid transport system protein [Lachnellula subtilissima]
MIPATGDTNRPSPNPELEDGVKIVVDVAESSRESSVSKTQEGIEELQRSHSQTEKDVFSEEGGVNFRTLSWPYAAVIFAKMTIGVGVLSIPSAMHTLGGVVGCLFILFWGLLNTYGAYLFGQYKLAHRSIHSCADGASILARDWSGGNLKWVAVTRNYAEFTFIFTWVVCGGVTTLAFTIALNAVSSHAICTVAFGAIAYFIIASAASIPKLKDLSWIAWVGFASIVAAILTVVIAVTQRERPAAAPQTDPYDLGFKALPPAGTTFAAAWSAALAIFSSSANTPAFLPVIAEFKKPQHYFRSVYVSMGFINAAYFSLGLTMFAYCGKWIASPALGSGGPTIKIISYALAIPGLIAGAVITIHIAAKTLFVRILRNTVHLEGNTKTRWFAWFGCTYGLGLIAWLLAEAVPFFNSLVALIGALGFAPLGVCLPALFWFHMHPGYRRGMWKQKTAWVLHVGMFGVGLFTLFVGTYAVINEIIDQFKNKRVGEAFSCADNSM